MMIVLQRRSPKKDKCGVSERRELTPATTSRMNACDTNGHGLSFLRFVYYVTSTARKHDRGLYGRQDQLALLAAPNLRV